MVGTTQSCEECGDGAVGGLRRGRCRPCYRHLLRSLKKSGEYVPWSTSNARPRTLEQRIESLRGDVSACWIWDGEMNARGYGRVSVNGKNQMAHRAFYERLQGPVPDGLVLDHLCRTRACVNPAHLEPVTNAVNVMRGVGVGAQNANKTHCVYGHAFTPENTRLGPPRRPTGGPVRACRQCLRNRAHARRQAAKSHTEEQS